MESNVLVRYNPTQRSFMDPSSSTSSWRNSNDDVDFNDVFGGPPRRYSSASDVRNNSMSEANSESRRFSRGEDESISSGSARWSGLGDKPVFGDEGMNRRRNTSADFFDDIFRSSVEDKDSQSSLPSRTESYCSSPLPVQLSLPAKLNNGTDDSRRSSLSMEFSLGADGSVKVTEFETDPGITLKKDLNSSSGVPINRSQFHFSIHKWASKGAPPMFSLRNAKSSSKVKDNSISRFVSSDGRIKNDDNTISKLPIDEALSDGLDFFNGVELKKDGDELLFNTVIQDNTILNSLHEKCEEKEKVTTKLFEEANKSELEPLPSILFDNDDEQGNRSKNDKTKDAAGVKEKMESITKKSSANSFVGGGIKRRDGKRAIYNDAEEDITMSPPARSGENVERNKVKGKVSEFVKIFNQETPSKRVTNGNTQNQNRRREGVGVSKPERAIKVNAARVDDIISTPIRDEKKISVTSPVKEPPIQPKDVKVSATTEDKKLSTPTTEKQKISVEEHSRLLSEHDLGKGPAYTTIPIVSDAYEQKDSSSSTASISDGSKATITSIDDFFEDNFSVQEIFIDQTKPPEIIKDEEDFRASDAKIREWSYGKETNIRSLLSTLQYVLWDRSGWKPVPLVDIIEGNAVKRAYQKALLCLHPDKLQQKGASALTKYIAEKVFDILQDAWENFNSLGSI